MTRLERLAKKCHDALDLCLAAEEPYARDTAMAANDDERAAIATRKVLVENKLAEARGRYRGEVARRLERK